MAKVRRVPRPRTSPRLNKPLPVPSGHEGFVTSWGAKSRTDCELEGEAQAQADIVFHPELRFGNNFAVCVGETGR